MGIVERWGEGRGRVSSGHRKTGEVLRLQCYVALAFRAHGMEVQETGK